MVRAPNHEYFDGIAGPVRPPAVEPTCSTKPERGAWTPEVECRAAPAGQIERMVTEAIDASTDRHQSPRSAKRLQLVVVDPTRVEEVAPNDAEALGADLRGELLRP